MSQQGKLLMMAVLSTICLTLLVTGIFVGDPAVIGSWAVIDGLGAATFAHWYIATAERLRMERLAEIYAAASVLGDDSTVKRIY